MPTGSVAGLTVIGGQLMAKVSARVVAQPLASVARTVTTLLISALGVPLTTPAALNDKPAGKVPLATLQV